MQKRCLGFLLTNYVTYRAAGVFISFIRDFQFVVSYRPSEEGEARSQGLQLKGEASESFWDNICKFLGQQKDHASANILPGVPVTALLLLVASTNAADHTMQMLAVAPFIPLLIYPLPIPYPYHQIVTACSSVVTAIVGVGASVSMIKSEFF